MKNFEKSLNMAHKEENELKKALWMRKYRTQAYEFLMPEIIKVINSYAGKQYGEKTEQKIYDEILKKTGFCIHIKTDGHQSIYARTVNAYDSFEISVEYCSPIISPSNTINHVNGNEFYLYNPTTEFTVEGEYKRIVKAYERMQKAANELSEMIREYNGLVPDNYMQNYNLYITHHKF